MKRFRFASWSGTPAFTGRHYEKSETTARDQLFIANPEKGQQSVFHDVYVFYRKSYEKSM